MTRHRSLLVAVVALAAMVVAQGPPASATTLYFVGHADDDSDTTIQFTAKGRYKKTNKAKTFVAAQVSSIRVYDQWFICYTAGGAPSGHSGRHTYGGYSLIDPLEVNGKGLFGGFYQHVYQSPYGGDPLTLEYDRFRGRVKNRTASGAYQTQASEGGIEFGYCGDREPVEWTAKAQRRQPEPPPEVPE